MREKPIDNGWFSRLTEIIVYSDTHLLEICLGLTLLAKASYGGAFRGYPLPMLVSGVFIALYVLWSALGSSLDHRHRAVSLMSVYYATHIYASVVKINIPALRVIYLILTLLLPPLYLKWRLYREKIYRGK